VNGDSRLWLAERKAEQFVAERPELVLPIDPFQIAAKLDIEVKAKPETARGVSGMLLRQGESFGILYATHVPSEGFQRFSVGHELGHFLLDGHIDHVLPNGDGVHQSRAGFLSGDKYELEADHFAAGLLMPDALFKRALARASDGLDGITELSALCKTSLTATAIRYAQKTSTCLAVVVSTGATIDYCFMSESLKEFENLDWLKKGETVPVGVETRSFNLDPENVRLARRSAADADLRDWFRGRRSLVGTEEIVGLGAYGKTLTVLTTEAVADEEDEEDELKERWAVRFRR
jgi:hypothetical protein